MTCYLVTVREDTFGERGKFVLTWVCLGGRTLGRCEVEEVYYHDPIAGSELRDKFHRMRVHQEETG